MRKIILQIITLLLIFMLIYYFVDILFLKKDILASIVKLIPLLLLFVSTLILLLNIKNQHLNLINNMMTFVIYFQAVFILFNPIFLPVIWNFTLALIVLLAGINLIGAIKNTKLIFALPTGISIVFLEFILLFKIEQAFLYSIAFVLLLIMTLVSLFSILSNK